MRELLEKLKDVMPSGWEVGMEKEMLFILEHPESGEMHYLALAGGDRGLAPLTALLKQELALRWHQFGVMYGEGQVYVETDAEAGLMYDTEFEAVALAYLSLRPKEANE